jgi:hypothetical protein
MYPRVWQVATRQEGVRIEKMHEGKVRFSPALDTHGRPVFLISTMAMHTQNLKADPRASLFVTEPDASGDPLGSSESR